MHADPFDFMTIKSVSTTKLGFLQERPEDQLSASKGIETFPPEVLGKIFVLCAPRKAVVIPPNLKSPPWTLGRVCSRWRQILWNTPDLWNCLEVRNEPSHKEVSTIPVAVRAIISRSHGLISMTAPVLNVASVLSTILSFPHRFTHLNLKIDHASLCTILELPGHSLNHLESIDITIRQRHLSLHFPVYTYTSLQTSPNLKFFSIRGAEFSVCPPHLLLLPWGQLTRLQWSIKIPPSTIYSILSQCTHLQNCEIHIRSEISQESFRAAHIVVPNLSSLSLNFGGSGVLDWDKFLGPFDFPSLKDLRVYTYASHLSHQTLVTLICRSSCELEGLSLIDHSIRGYNFGHRDNCDLLQATPSLQVLETLSIMPSTTFDAISLGLLPRLHSLICGVQPKGFHAFIDLMDHYTQLPPEALYRGVFSAKIGCYEALGIDQAYKRFRGVSPIYLKDGRDITVTRTRL